MKKNRRCLLRSVCIGIIGLGVILSIAIFIKAQKKPIIRMGDFSIRIKSVEYSSQVELGIIELIVENKKHSKEKFFLTEDDVKHNGKKQLQGVDKHLDISCENQQAVVWGEEIKRGNKEQHIKVVYFVPGYEEEGNTINIQVRNQSGNKQQNSLEFSDITTINSRELTSEIGSPKLWICDNGIAVSFVNGKYYQTNMGISHLNITYKNGSSDTLLAVNEYNALEYKTNAPAFSYVSRDRLQWYYYWEIGNIDDVESVSMNNMNYK